MSAARLFKAGFLPLLPVIPPGASISPRSKVKPDDAGKIPGKLTGRGWVGYADWPNAPVPTAKDIRRWHEWGANVGIKAAEFPGVDIDVDHPVLAKVVEKYALEHLGSAPVRLSRGDRRLLVYSTDRPFPKYALKLRYKGEDHVVEVLGTGNQYLVAGKHPDGPEYRWDGRPLWEYHPDDLTVIRRSNVTKFFRALADDLIPRGVEVKLTTGKRTRDKIPPQEGLRAPSLDDLERVVSMIPNTYPERDDYIKFGCAVKAAGGDEALPIFAEWASRWEGGENDPEVVEADWAGMHPPFQVGWEWLRQRSGDDARDEFDADPDARPPAPRMVHFSDVQFAQEILPDCAELRHRKDWKRFMGKWKDDDTLAFELIVREGLRKIALGLDEAAKVEETKKVQDALRAKARYLQSRSGINNITSLIRASLTEPEDDWDASTTTLNTREGTYEL